VAEPRPLQTVPVLVPVDGGAIEGELAIPAGAAGAVVFAHGSGSSRRSPRNRRVAERLQREGLATLLADLLTGQEEAVDQRDGRLRFDVNLLAERVVTLTHWLEGQSLASGLPVGYFGASTGAAAALVAAARDPSGQVKAVVSRGGRPDLAGDVLAAVRAPTLLIVGGRDEVVLRLNRQAAARLGGAHRLEVVPGATHLFEEPGALEQVSELAAGWFNARLGSHQFRPGGSMDPAGVRHGKPAASPRNKGGQR
jgi:dienelactone hydrolase